MYACQTRMVCAPLGIYELILPHAGAVLSVIYSI